MTDQPSNGLPDRVERLEVDMLDVKVSLNRLIDIFYQSDARTTDALERTTNAIERLSEAQIRTLTIVEEMQSEVRGLQTENRRIWQVISDRLGLE
ncbi:hypothetical protein C7B65_26505 [Phormidesmis priestleyi ULC007]|uniref:Uncharacterized protein n=1 Tax=Phormidesmis priestleyi ULC007 TaxID=1920490 RepID=A0A2T1D1M7_9CYAN|nr:hypothetical protein [Phormidesmis priestleyi]PSB14402.1 hypothetical protein C7B65_26505 [Phormidesmis priestleyi ULC007]PZO49392.1 MAG: hypothetical protein DCF14_14710 [Phormidesmis priestleyi]